MTIRLSLACSLPFSSCEECVEMHRKGLEEVGKREQNVISICNLKEGERGTISFIRGERKVLQRLSDMGLTPNCQVKLLRKCSFHGPLEIEVRGVNLAVGYSLATDVFVQPSKEVSN